jgi:hypothetical protein
MLLPTPEDRESTAPDAGRDEEADWRLGKLRMTPPLDSTADPEVFPRVPLRMTEGFSPEIERPGLVGLETGP